MELPHFKESRSQSWEEEGRRFLEEEWRWNTLRHVKVKQKTSVLNMLKRLDKIRFRGHKRDEFLDLAESPNASDNECNDEVPVKQRTSFKETDDLRDLAVPGNLAMAAAIQDFQRTESERLNEIKGHLEIALLEKHFLQEELKKLREETNVEILKQELEKERLKRVELEHKVNELLKTRAEESAAQQLAKSQVTANGTDKRGDTFCSRFQKWFYDRFGVYVEDFRFQPEENTIETEEPLSAKRGWRIQWSIVPEVSEPVEPPKEDLTVSEKFQLVLDVAQKAQVVFTNYLFSVQGRIKNLFGKMADVLEKIKNARKVTLLWSWETAVRSMRLTGLAMRIVSVSMGLTTMVNVAPCSLTLQKVRGCGPLDPGFSPLSLIVGLGINTGGAIKKISHIIG
ncbi:GRAM4 protein, partial [Polypterus senegalus]